MAVAVVIEREGATLDRYDQVLAKMGRRPGGRSATGCLFHWVATEHGIRATDVWQTREEFETFAAEQVCPLSSEVGFPAPPEITFHAVHNYGSADGPA